MENENGLFRSNPSFFTVVTPSIQMMHKLVDIHALHWQTVSAYTPWCRVPDELTPELRCDVFKYYTEKKNMNRFNRSNYCLFNVYCASLITKYMYILVSESRVPDWRHSNLFSNHLAFTQWKRSCLRNWATYFVKICVVYVKWIVITVFKTMHVSVELDQIKSN